MKSILIVLWLSISATVAITSLMNGSNKIEIIIHFMTLIGVIFIAIKINSL